jgi:hypothetical protein
MQQRLNAQVAVPGHSSADGGSPKSAPFFPLRSFAPVPALLEE